MGNSSRNLSPIRIIKTRVQQKLTFRKVNTKSKKEKINSHLDKCQRHWYRGHKISIVNILRGMHAAVISIETYKRNVKNDAIEINYTHDHFSITDI